MLFTLVFLHVLGACVWAGGHLYLALGVLPKAFAQRDANVLRDAETLIERIAMPALLIQVLTGVELARRYAGGFVQMFDADDPVDHFVIAKVGLLLVTIALAGDAHMRRGRFEGMAWLRFMAWHVIVVTIIAVALVALGVGFRTGTMF